MLMRWLRLLLASIVTLGVIGVTACGSDPPSIAPLQEKDLAAPEGAGEKQKFDRNAVVDPAAFTDIETLDVAAVQKFLAKSPYDRPSFLETYQSNGVRASDAIVRAARQYRINP